MSFGASHRRMERFIGYHGYNNLPVPGRLSVVDPEAGTPIAKITYLKSDKRTEVNRYVKDENGNMVDPETKKIVGKDLSNKIDSE